MNMRYDIFRMTQSQLKMFLTKELTKCNYKPIGKNGYLFAKGTVPVLLVAHMDTVHKEIPKDICISDTGIIMSPQGIGGDDRCGIIAILEIVKKLKCSVVFTEDEEIGCVGAQKFANTKLCSNLDVNFIVEIDRRGSNDAVFYECGNFDFQSMVEKYGFITQSGSFSDICVIAPEVGVAAVNISSGYYNEHRTEEHINVNELAYNIERLIDLITNESHNRYEYIESSYYNSGYYNDYYGQFSYLSEDAVIVFENGKILECEDCEQEIFIGIDNLLYLYDYETDEFTHMENVRAYDKNGHACKFNDQLLFY